MNKNTKKFSAIVIVILLISILIFTLSACKKKPKVDDPKESSDLPIASEKAPGNLTINNGEFFTPQKEEKPQVFPTAPSGWTNQNVTAEHTVAGIISLNPSEYDKYKDKWNSLSNPGKWTTDENQDNRALMVYNKVAVTSAAGYSQTSIIIEQLQHYRVDVWIYSAVEADAASLSIRDALSPSAAKAEVFSTSAGEWQKLQLYVKGSNSSYSHKIKIFLLNHKEGHVFFDSISLNEIEKADYDAVVDDKLKFDFSDLDTNFAKTNRGEGVVSSSPSYYSYQTFEDYASANKTSMINLRDLEGNIFDTTDEAIKKKIVDSFVFDTTTDNVVKLSDDQLTTIMNLGANDDGSYLLVINDAKEDAKSAGGFYQSNFTLNLLAGQKYVFKTRVMTLVSSKDTTTSSIPVTFGITNGTRKSYAYVAKHTQDVAIDNWVDIEFVIQADPYRNMEFNIAFGLGDGLNANSIKGGVLFDYYSLEIDNSSAITPIVELNPAADEKANQNKATSWDIKVKENSSLDASDVSIIDDNAAEKPFDTAEVIVIENANSSASISTLKKDEFFKVAAQSHYALSFWIRTEDLKDKKGINIELLDKENKALSSFTNINTETAKKAKDGLNNFYIQYTFLIENISQDELQVGLKITFGDGSRLSPDNLLKGKVYVAGINFYKMRANDYLNGKFSTPNNKVSLYKDSSNFKNNSFEYVDYATTINNFGLDPATRDYYKDKAIPTNWNASDPSALKKKSDGTEAKISAGIFTPSDAAFFDGIIENGVNPLKNKSVLKIEALDATKSFGFVSANAITLNANSYAEIVIRAKVKENTTKAYIVLGSDTFAQTSSGEINSTTWKEFRFCILTGFTSTTIKIHLYLGDKANSSDTAISAAGTAYFDLVTVNTSYDKEKFETVNEDDTSTHKTIKKSVEINSFDNVKIDAIDTSVYSPMDWRGSSSTTVEKPEDYVFYGVFDRNKYDLAKWQSDKDTLTQQIAAYEETLPEDPTEEQKAELERLKKELSEVNAKIDKVSKFSPSIDSLSDLDDVLKAHGNVLFINNLQNYDYKYSMSSSFTFAKDSYYKISVEVLLANISQNGKVTLSLSLGEYNSPIIEFSKLNEWTTCEFYIKTTEQTTLAGANINLALGTAKEQVKGLVFFDTVSISKSSQADFDAAKVLSESNPLIKAENLKDATKIDPSEKPDETKAKQKSLLWVYISTSAVSVTLVAIVIIIFVKKSSRKIKVATDKKSKKRKKPVAKNKGKKPSNQTRDRFKN